MCGDKKLRDISEQYWVGSLKKKNMSLLYVCITNLKIKFKSWHRSVITLMFNFLSFFSARFDGWAIFRDVIGCVCDSFTTNPTRELSTNVKKRMLCDKAMSISLRAWAPFGLLVHQTMSNWRHRLWMCSPC